jgi:hypothetical protein
VKKSRFTDEQIAYALKQQELGEVPMNRLDSGAVFVPFHAMRLNDDSVL